jgi:hypothetical protein
MISLKKSTGKTIKKTLIIALKTHSRKLANVRVRWELRLENLKRQTNQKARARREVKEDPHVKIEHANIKRLKLFSQLII